MAKIEEFDETTKEEVKKATDASDEEVPEEEEETTDSSQSEDIDAEETEEKSPKKDDDSEPSPASKKDDDEEDTGKDGLHDVDSETPKERALRAELLRTRRELREQRSSELLKPETPKASLPKKEIDQEKKKILERYKPEEVQAFREVFDVMAEDMGFVRKDALTATTYNERSQNELDGFLEKHPEYLPENDTDGLLWGRFKEEYKLYRQPENPKDFQKIFNKIHRDVLGIKIAGDGKSITAAREKAKAASHAGTSQPPRHSPDRRTKASSQGYRLDMLQGFTEEEKEELLRDE